MVWRFTITGSRRHSLAVTGCLTPLTSQPPQPTPPKQLAPVPTPASPLLGVYEPGSPSSYGGVTGFTSATGVKPKIVVYDPSWNDPFATSFAETAGEHGAYVLVQLEPSNVSLASIAAGKSDSYLRSYAQAVAAFGFPVILSFGYEMNGNWYSWGDGHRPQRRTSPRGGTSSRCSGPRRRRTSPGCGR